jgi:hypothetical protein
MLGYYPADDRRDNRFRRIEVKVKRPDLKVRARKGYVRGPEPPAPSATTVALQQVLDAPLPMGGLPMTVFASPFKAATPGKASVAVTVQVMGTDLKFEEKSGIFEDDLEIVTVAFDQHGKVHTADRQSIELKLKPQTHDVVSKSGFRVISRIEVPPGRYQVRVGAREISTNRMGSVHYDLDVPDYAKTPLAMSGVTLSSKRAAALPTARPDEKLQSLLGGPPTTARAFAAGDTLTAYVELYGSAATTGRVDLETRVVGPQDKVVFRSRDEINASELQAAGYSHKVDVPLGVPAGSYVLRIEATPRVDKASPLVREVPFYVIVPPRAPSGQ